jgi:hypothetical protein
MKEEMLRTYLADELFAEKGYLRPGEAETFRWTDARKNKLIEVIKRAIEGVDAGQTDGIIERGVNQMLNTGA